MRVRKKHVGIGLLTATALLSTALVIRRTRAADHLDSPRTRAEPQADIDDVYAWVPKAGRTAMVMTVGDTFIAPGSKFGSRIEYRFVIRNVVSKDGKVVPAAGVRDIVCTADDAADQTVTCTTSSGTSKTHVLNATASCDETVDEVCLWAGIRKDPDFVDLEAIERSLDGGLPELVDAGGNDILQDSRVLALVLNVDTVKVLGTADAGAGETATAVIAVAGETTRMR